MKYKDMWEELLDNLKGINYDFDGTKYRNMKYKISKDSLGIVAFIGKRGKPYSKQNVKQLEIPKYIPEEQREKYVIKYINKNYEVYGRCKTILAIISMTFIRERW